MKTKTFLIPAIIVLIMAAFACLVSCDKNDQLYEDNSLVFNYRQWGGMLQHDENLKITKDYTSYSIKHMNPTTGKIVEYSNTIKTSSEVWYILIKSFDLKTFNKIQNGKSDIPLDGMDILFTTTIEEKDYSFFNGYDDSHYKQMQTFFDTMLEQVEYFVNQRIEAMWDDGVNEEIDTLKVGEITEIESGKTVENSKYGLSLRVVNINDSRCPEGVMCVWEGDASVEFELTTKRGKHNFALDTHSSPNFKNDTIIEGVKYRLRNVLPYPVHGEEQLTKTVRILVDNADGVNEYFNAIVLEKGLDCGNSFLICFEDDVTGLPSPYKIYYAINLPEKYKIKNERISVKFREPSNDEIMVCTTMGPSYPQIYIVEVK